MVDFLTRSECHLCEEALPRVAKAARRARLSVRLVDIETDDLLTGMYGLRIPVVLAPDGSVIAEGTMTGELTSTFRKWRRAQVGRPRLLRRRR